MITILYFGKYSKLKEEHISLIQECDRLKGIIEEQSQRLSSLKGEYDFACKEVKKLANEISAKVGDCSIGPWCNGCEHKMEAVIKKKSYDCTNMWTSYSGESVIYCGKHLHEICPEFEKEHRPYPHWAV